MLPTVHFDYQSRFQTDEVYNERPEGLLPAKLASAELPGPNRAPQNALGVGGVLP